MASRQHNPKSKTLGNKYMLGDEIGKGAYGRVYKGLDLENGDFVAIKQVSLENIPQEDLNIIMQEIDLLKVLLIYDGAFDGHRGAGGWGYVIRDQAGDFIAAGAGKSVNLKSALQSESVACLAAIDGAIRFGANRIIFESDSSTLVHALRSNDYDKATIGVLVKEARSLCILNFDSYAFSFDRRTCNSVAHELAKLGVHSESYDSFWEASAPNCIVKLMASDIAVHDV